MKRCDRLLAFTLSAVFAGVSGFGLIPLTIGCGKAGQRQAAAPAVVWSCPMHPQIVSDKPGKCPICGMPLAKRPADSPPGPTTTAPSSPSAVAAPSEASVTLGAEAIRAAGIVTVPVESGELAHEMRAVGAIQADETRLVHVAARVPGRVERLHANFTGETVRRGALLYELYSPELVATQREYLLALENRQRLAGAGSEASRGAESLVSASGDRLRLWGVTESQIRKLEKTRRPDLAIAFPSPASGTVLQKNVITGQYV